MIIISQNEVQLSPQVVGFLLLTAEVQSSLYWGVLFKGHFVQGENTDLQFHVLFMAVGN